ncbi:MAG: FHA domain-containing protein [Proteobacteria bacterium]|nr:FHA domain-containing protein [Pseudomonadota bacterium]
MLQLQVIYGKDAGKCVRFQQSVVYIGSDPGNDFQLNDSEISEYHGQFVCNHEAGHYAYCDLQSTRGSRIRSSSLDVELFSHQMPQSVALAGECMLWVGQSMLRCTYMPGSSLPMPSEKQRVGMLSLHGLPATNDTRLLSFLLDTSTALSMRTSSQNVFTHLVRALMTLMPHATHVAIWRYDSCRDGFTCVYERSKSNTVILSLIRENDFREAIRSRCAFSFCAHKSSNPVASMVAPIVASNRELGVIVADSSEPDGLDDDALEIMARISVVSAYAIERTFLNSDFSTVFDGFIRAIIAVMDARDPASAGHSMRVAKYALFTAQAIHSSQDKPFQNITFSSHHLDELRFASLLHDIGKVALRREILLKANKLTQSALDHLLERIDLFAAWFSTQSPEKLGQDYRSPQQFDHYREIVTRVVQADAKATACDKEYISEMANTFITPCPDRPLLSAAEKECLLIERGTLNAEERLEIERHALISWQYLSKIPWPERWANVPVFVLQHHEKLNGSGYPYGIAGEKILLQSRIITVCDIFDALTGGDRSYKTRHSFGDAAQILMKEAREGALDGNIVEIFISQVIPQISDPDVASGVSMAVTLD